MVSLWEWSPMGVEMAKPACVCSLPGEVSTGLSLERCEGMALQCSLEFCHLEAQIGLLLHCVVIWMRTTLMGS